MVKDYTANFDGGGAWHIIGEWTMSYGYRISGTAAIAGNGNLAGFTGSSVTVEITGGDAVAFSNLAITFGGGAVNHFGAGTIKGVVTHDK